ncbi:MAG: RNA polymerase sigma factor [Limisphaerales bacterium]
MTPPLDRDLDVDRTCDREHDRDRDPDPAPAPAVGPDSDTEAIAAVRAGDTDRFRELIERYERHVYAVAWSRLGDATLAEDVVQESFIRAFRLLGWVRRPERFAGWITSIARAVSINLGLRHRRELKRRERWALDP